MADINNIKVLCFSSDNYNLDELNAMTEKERFELANTAKCFGYDETEVLSLPEFQRLYNNDIINTIDSYIFFYLEA